MLALLYFGWKHGLAMDRENEPGEEVSLLYDHFAQYFANEFSLIHSDLDSTLVVTVSDGPRVPPCPVM